MKHGLEKLNLTLEQKSILFRNLVTINLKKNKSDEITKLLEHAIDYGVNDEIEFYKALILLRERKLEECIQFCENKPNLLLVKA